MNEIKEKEALYISEQGSEACPPKKQRLFDAAMAEFAEYSYGDASTDRITEASGVSKGLLFHYFGSKKALYLSCLNRSLILLTDNDGDIETGGAQGTEGFYGILFKIMDEKVSLCLSHRTPTRLVNLASRENAMEIVREKNELLNRYAAEVRTRSSAAMQKAVAALKLKKAEPWITEGLLLYTNALIGRYLALYQNEPEKFFENAQEIKKELRGYLDMMLYGIIKA